MLYILLQYSDRSFCRRRRANAIFRDLDNERERGSWRASAITPPPREFTVSVNFEVDGEARPVENGADEQIGKGDITWHRSYCRCCVDL